VEATNDAGEIVGVARLTARLDERGTVSPPRRESSLATTPSRRGVDDAVASPVPVPSAMKPPAPTARAQTRHVVVGTSPERDPRSGVEYKIAYDLEVWKHQHMNAFMDELREKESARMKILEDEWRVRETRRARDAEDAAQRARAMEKKLKDAAHTLEMRERKLVELEESIEYRKNKLERDAARTQDEARDVVRRNVESSEHRVEMEKHKAKEAIRERDALQRRLEHAEARLVEIEGAFAAHKKAQLETSEAALQAELARITPRCEAAEAQALEESQSKERYKGQLTKMARQVVALERERTHLRRAIDRAGINISSRAHAAPSANEFMNEMLAGEGAEADAFMASFRADVNAVAAGGAFKGSSDVHYTNAPRPKKPSPTEYVDEIPRAEDDFSHVENLAPVRHTSNAASLQEIRAAEKEVRRLVTERGDLMRTGMYSSGDKIISMIDARIEELTDRIASV
jgi:centrosomal protein CEP120